VQLVSAQPVRSNVRGLPEKRVFGSDYPFRDGGQLDHVAVGHAVNPSLVSGAYGGFTNVWGSQAMPYNAATFSTWPFAAQDIEPHYRAIMASIPYAAEEDDLASLFPLVGEAEPLPPMSNRTSLALASYRRHRSDVRRLGIIAGRARLAFAASKCVRCGLCMTGCPYSLMYSAAQTLDDLRSKHLVKYHSGLMALTVGEEDGKAWVDAKDLKTGRVRRFDADRIFIACGAFGTTRLVLGSLGLFSREVALKESVQFTLPFWSRVPTPDPCSEDQFTLNQFNVVVAFDDVGFDVSQLHFYTYNPAFLEALPTVLRSPMARPLTIGLLRHLSVALGYLPSWHSPGLRVTAQPGLQHGDLPKMTVSRAPAGWRRDPMLSRVLARLVKAAPYLDLWPIIPKLMMAAGGKSYHWGGSFPHARSRTNTFTSDLLGRTGPWERIHMVDASVFPNVPATTFALTVMTNAHRIASEALREPW
jgi:ferredoxin